MSERPPTTRDRILDAAGELFLERGYHATSLQEVADRIGITKPALYYHFASKADVLGALLEPMTTELERALGKAVEAGETGGLAAVRIALMTGWLDVYLTYRGTLVALMRDLAAIPSDVYARLIDVMDRAVRLAAGPDAGLPEQIMIAQAVSAITDPVALMPDVPAGVLREQLLGGAWRLLGVAPPGAPVARGRGGRPARMSAVDIARARRMYDSGGYTAEQLAASFGVSRATIYRHLRH